MDVTDEVQKTAVKAVDRLCVKVAVCVSFVCHTHVLDEAQKTTLFVAQINEESINRVYYG